MTMENLTISRPSLPETFFSDEVHLLTLLKMQNLEGLANWCSPEKSRRKRIVSKIWKTMSNWMVYRSSGSPKSHMMWTVAPWSERVRGSYSHVLEYYHDLLTGGIWAPNSHSSLKYSRDLILADSPTNLEPPPSVIARYLTIWPKWSRGCISDLSGSLELIFHQ